MNLICNPEYLLYQASPQGMVAVTMPCSPDTLIRPGSWPWHSLEWRFPNCNGPIAPRNSIWIYPIILPELGVPYMGCSIPDTNYQNCTLSRLPTKSCQLGFVRSAIRRDPNEQRLKEWSGVCGFNLLRAKNLMLYKAFAHCSPSLSPYHIRMTWHSMQSDYMWRSFLSLWSTAFHETHGPIIFLLIPSSHLLLSWWDNFFHVSIICPLRIFSLKSGPNLTQCHTTMMRFHWH